MGEPTELIGGVGCAHWQSPLDIVAIRFHCCGHVYPCLHCHNEAETHPVEPWPVGEDGEVVLCRACGHWMTATEYLEVYRGCGSRVSSDRPASPEPTVSSGSSSPASTSTAPACPSCAAAFNPGCALHTGVYIDTGS